MKHIILALLLITSLNLMAQTTEDNYRRNLNHGIELFNKGEYEKAKNSFSITAHRFPEKNAEVKKWIGKCNSAISKPTSTTVTKPQETSGKTNAVREQKKEESTGFTIKNLNKTYISEQTFDNGNHYKGEWRNGRIWGKGIYTWKDSGNTYEGDWIDGKMHGFGIYTWPTKGMSYTGYFANGKRHGQGALFGKDGEKYIGDFVNDLFEGYGELEYANGTRYEGQFVAGKREGQGTLYSKKGKVKYTGLWYNDKKAK